MREQQWQDITHKDYARRSPRRPQETSSDALRFTRNHILERIYDDIHAEQRSPRQESRSPSPPPPHDHHYRMSTPGQRPETIAPATAPVMAPPSSSQSSSQRLQGRPKAAGRRLVSAGPPNDATPTATPTLPIASTVHPSSPHGPYPTYAPADASVASTSPVRDAGHPSSSSSPTRARPPAAPRPPSSNASVASSTTRVSRPVSRATTLFNVIPGSKSLEWSKSFGAKGREYAQKCRAQQRLAQAKRHSLLENHTISTMPHDFLDIYHELVKYVVQYVDRQLAPAMSFAADYCHAVRSHALATAAAANASGATTATTARATATAAAEANGADPWSSRASAASVTSAASSTVLRPLVLQQMDAFLLAAYTTPDTATADEVLEQRAVSEALVVHARPAVAFQRLLQLTANSVINIRPATETAIALAWILDQYVATDDGRPVSAASAGSAVVVPPTAASLHAASRRFLREYARVFKKNGGGRCCAALHCQ
eukprot:gene16289-11648_t